MDIKQPICGPSTSQEVLLTGGLVVLLDSDASTITGQTAEQRLVREGRGEVGEEGRKLLGHMGKWGRGQGSGELLGCRGSCPPIPQHALLPLPLPSPNLTLAASNAKQHKWGMGTAAAVAVGGAVPDCENPCGAWVYAGSSPPTTPFLHKWWWGVRDDSICACTSGCCHHQQWWQGAGKPACS